MISVRPTRSFSFPKSDTFGFELLAEIRLVSGYTEMCSCLVEPHDCGTQGARVSQELVERAGGHAKCHATKWDEPLWGPTDRTLVPLDISIPAKVEHMTSCVLAEIATKPGKFWGKTDVILHADILRSLADVSLTDEQLHLRQPRVDMFTRWSIDDLITRAVLVLGPDRKNRLRTLRFIEAIVNGIFDYRAWLLRDYHDVAGRDVIQKLFAMAGTSAFIIAHDSVASGHLAEVQALSALTTPLAVLRAQGKGSTWMLDPLLGTPHVKLFEYPAASNMLGLYKAVMRAVSWARLERTNKSKDLDSKYPWRKREILLADELFPPWEKLVEREARQKVRRIPLATSQRRRSRQ